MDTNNIIHDLSIRLIYTKDKRNFDKINITADSIANYIGLSGYAIAQTIQNIMLSVEPTGNAQKDAETIYKKIDLAIYGRTGYEKSTTTFPLSENERTRTKTLSA